MGRRHLGVMRLSASPPRYDAAQAADTSQETPEIACDVTRRALSFDWKSTQIGEYIMPRCKLLVPAAIFAVLVGGAGVVSAYTGEELAKDAKITLAEARAIALKAFLEKSPMRSWRRKRAAVGYAIPSISRMAA